MEIIDGQKTSAENDMEVEATIRLRGEPTAVDRKIQQIALLLTDCTDLDEASFESHPK